MNTKTKTPALPKAELPADLDSLAAVALTALPKCSAEQREDLSCGDHEVDLDLHVRIRGMLKVGADHSAVQANLLPWQEMAALLANRLPQSVVDEVLAEAIVVAQRGRESAPAEALKAAAEDLKGRVEAAFEQAKAMVKTTRKGSVRLLGHLEIEEV